MSKVLDSTLPVVFRLKHKTVVEDGVTKDTVETTYTCANGMRVNIQDVPILFKKYGGRIRILGQTHSVHEYIFDVDNGNVAVALKPIVELGGRVKAPAFVVPEGWIVVKREVLSSVRLPKRPAVKNSKSFRKQPSTFKDVDLDDLDGDYQHVDVDDDGEL